WMVQSLSEEGGGTTDKMGKQDNDVSRAVVEDDTALLLAAVDSIKKAALGRLRNGSDAARILDQEMSNRLLHLACRHDAAECARLLLDGEYGITPASVDARDQLTRTPLHVAAEAHSKRCIQLLLSVSRNARTDVRLLDGTHLVALEVALMSRRVQVDWSLDNSVEDLLAYLQQKDLNAVRLLAEKTREVGEVAYRYAMEGRVAALAMLLLVAEERISAMVSVVIDGVRTKRSIYNSVVDEVLSIGEASAREGNEMRRKALLCEIQLLNQFGATSWRDRKVDRKSLPPLLRAAKAGDMNLTKMLLMGDVHVNETDPEGNTALHWCLSSSSSTQEPRIVWLLQKNGARVFQGNKLGLTPVHSAAAKGNYKALQSLLLHAQDCVDIPSKTKETPLFLAVKNGSLSCVRLLLRYGANPKAQNLRKQRPIDVATSQDMRFLLNSANVVPMNHGSMEKNHAMKKERHKELPGDDFNDYDNGDYYESYVVPKASVGHRDFRVKSKGNSAPKEGPKLSRLLTTYFIYSIMIIGRSMTTLAKSLLGVSRFR
uniref:PGG domain-containing protein n=1 Tax=Aegilops tauschii subsp. strangulata TaxID=200361 RepID=A0A453JXD0_AEGTS